MKDPAGFSCVAPGSSREPVAEAAGRRRILAQWKRSQELFRNGMEWQWASHHWRCSGIGGAVVRQENCIGDPNIKGCIDLMICGLVPPRKLCASGDSVALSEQVAWWQWCIRRPPPLSDASEKGHLPVSPACTAFCVSEPWLPTALVKLLPLERRPVPPTRAGGAYPKPKGHSGLVCQSRGGSLTLGQSWVYERVCSLFTPSPPPFRDQTPSALES